jgi:transcriptional regulator with XRE-family HTH domain
MDVRRRLGSNLKKLREEQGYSQESFADHCGLHRAYISGIERGVRNPIVVIVDKIAKALKVPAGQLLDEPERCPGKADTSREPPRAIVHSSGEGREAARGRQNDLPRVFSKAACAASILAGSKPSLWAKRAFIAAMLVAAATDILSGAMRPVNA